MDTLICPGSPPEARPYSDIAPRSATAFVAQRQGPPPLLLRMEAGAERSAAGGAVAARGDLRVQRGLGAKPAAFVTSTAKLEGLGVRRAAHLGWPGERADKLIAVVVSASSQDCPFAVVTPMP